MIDWSSVSILLLDFNVFLVVFLPTIDSRHKGGAIDASKNFRSISLTSIPCKMVEPYLSSNSSADEK